MFAVLPVAALALAACSDDSDGSGASGASGKISIVASTNVYGDIAQAIAGDRATVTSFINSSSQDPHEYEASAQDRLAVEDADLVIENGAGYDHFVDTLLDGAKSDAPVLTAVSIAGLVPADEARGDEELDGVNEHVWYKFDAVADLAKSIQDELVKIDPDGASAFEANYQTFSQGIDGLESSATKLRATAQGKGVAITEPVPLYLLEAVGLVNKTPGDFSEAVEEGEDVPPRALRETLSLFQDKAVVLLAYNDQTADATTEQVRSAAETAGVPVVDFTETLPSGQSYLEWQQANIEHLSEALR
jgi:zinc/manganese transport system substrate-binding protein